MQYEYRIEGMHCTSCISKIQTALSSDYTITDLSLTPPRLILQADAAPSLAELNKKIRTAGPYQLQAASTAAVPAASIKVYYPLILIVLYITGVAFINNVSSEGINWQGWMHHFMAGFFLVFSAFKLLDLAGFADGYASYDLLAKRWPTYGYLYPFLELGLGILYLTRFFPAATDIATIIIMGFSSIGVINSLVKKQAFQCACLGTLLKVPLSSITLVEDLTMVLMAALSLYFG